MLLDKLNSKKRVAHDGVTIHDGTQSVYFSLSLTKGDEIFCAWDRHSYETVNLSKYVAEYEQIHKWTVEFLSKFQGRGIKIVQINSIRISKPFIFCDT